MKGRSSGASLGHSGGGCAHQSAIRSSMARARLLRSSVSYRLRAGPPRRIGGCHSTFSSSSSFDGFRSPCFVLFFLLRADEARFRYAVCLESARNCAGHLLSFSFFADAVMGDP